MAEFTRLLMDPSREELNQALAEAAGQANLRCRRNIVSWPPANLNRILGQVRARAEGQRCWEGGPGEPVSVVALAWWTDHGGRKHHRVGGERFEGRDDTDHSFFFPNTGRAVLPLVHPDFVLEQTRGGQWDPLAVCPCGVFGPPASLGWMGTRCGPCHDREQGGAPPPPFCQPTLHFHEAIYSLSFSPGGDLLAVGTRDALAFHDPATGEEQDIVPDRAVGGGGVHAAFSPAGGLLATFGPGRGLSLWGFPGSRRTALTRVVADRGRFLPRWAMAGGAVLGRKPGKHAVVGPLDPPSIAHPEVLGGPGEVVRFPGLLARWPSPGHDQ